MYNLSNIESRQGRNGDADAGKGRDHIVEEEEGMAN